MSIPAASPLPTRRYRLLLRKTDKAVIRGGIPVICVPARQLTLCAAAIDLLSFSADPGNLDNFARRGDWFAMRKTDGVSTIFAPSLLGLIDGYGV
jgi:hypothetical protein